MIKYRIVAIVAIFMTVILQIQAQTREASSPSQADVPFDASKISVSKETDLTVTITGEAGAVYPSTQIAVRNLYTNDTETVLSKSDSSFVATLFGLESMPYIISDGTDVWYMSALHDLYKRRTIIYPDFDAEQGVSFGIAGWVSHGWLPWLADSTINSLNFEQGDTISISMDVTFYDLHRVFFQNPLRIPDFEVQARLSLRQITDETGKQLLPEVDNSGHYAHWGWTSEMTVSGLPIHGQIDSDIVIATTHTTDINLDSDKNLVFTLNFESTIGNLPAGMYIPVFEGDFKIGDGEFSTWYNNLAFAADGTNGITTQATIKLSPIVMPFLISIGDVQR